MQQQKSMTYRWLQVLFYIHIVSAALTLLFLVSNVFHLSLGGEWATWVNRAVSLGTILCLFMLPGKFLPSGIARVGLLFCNIFPMLLAHVVSMEAYLNVLVVLQWVSPLLTLLAIFLEYNAHGMTAPENAGGWRVLTLVSIGVSLVSILLLPTLEGFFSDMLQAGNFWGIRVYDTGMYILTLVMDAWYLTLLRKNLQSVEKEV